MIYLQSFLTGPHAATFFLKSQEKVELGSVNQATLSFERMMNYYHQVYIITNI